MSTIQDEYSAPTSGAATFTARVGELLADLHVALHADVGVGLPRLLDALEVSSRAMPEPGRAAMQRRIERMPRGSNVCHGDFHPGNVILGKRPTLIDWVNAHASHPAVDVARSPILMRYQGVRAPLTDAVHAELQVRARVADVYLATGGVSFEQVAASEPFQAAALLHAQPEHPLREALQAIAARAWKTNPRALRFSRRTVRGRSGRSLPNCGRRSCARS